MNIRFITLLLTLFLTMAARAAMRTVSFPPPDSKPPPPMKAPPRTQASGEDTGPIIDFGPTMRKTQERQPPPPTTLTVMYKLEYGETLRYVHPDGAVQIFPQWKSYENDGSKIMAAANERLADGNNYQYATKPLASHGFDPVDIPLLYMTGDYDFTFSNEELENLRRFILEGGTIAFNAARGRDEFSKAVVREMKRVFPAKAFLKLAMDHPLFNARYRIQQLSVMINGITALQPPEVYSIDIGTRAAAILIPGGMGAAWSGDKYHPEGKHVVGESAIRLGVNLVAYILSNTEYSRFLAQEFPLYSSVTRPGDVFRFALARYAGAWDVNPAIQNSLLQGLKENTGIDVDYAPHYLDLDKPELMSYPLLFMNGHQDFELSKAEMENLRAYLNKGGLLVASAAAGFKPFDIAFRREIKKIFPDQTLVPIPPTHPVLTAGWQPIDRVEYTGAALRDDPTLQYPEFWTLFIDQRPAVLYTPFDFLSGLNRESNPYAKGLVSDDAMRLAIAIITFGFSQ